MVRCIHVAPELPPTVGGVADYAAILSQRLVEVSEGEVEPVLVRAGRARSEAPAVEGFQCVDLGGERSASTLANTIDRLAREAEGPSAVLLEYSGYGYASGGAPLWLLRGLFRVCGGARGLPLVTVFHELYASSHKPWKRAFWTWPLQYGLAVLLARMSEGSTANWALIARLLSRWTHNSVPVSPSFSNVGEPETLPAYGERQPYAVCFGRSGRKQEMYQQRGPEIVQALQQMGVERIIDMGPPVPKEATRGLGLPVERKGFLPADQISEVLQQAAVGILHYALHCLTKSGIWASYAAHGVPAILTDAAASEPLQNLHEGQHFMRLRGAAAEKRRPLASISQQARQWYQEHAHSRQAAVRLHESFFRPLLRPSTFSSAQGPA